MEKYVDSFINFNIGIVSTSQSELLGKENGLNIGDIIANLTLNEEILLHPVN